MTATEKKIDDIAIVVIGRNEGERLIQCFKSVLNETSQIVYVDSGSTDNSVTSAKELGVQVVTLDMGVPFTAARARNEGFYTVLRLFPAAKYVQFVDGDCQVCEGWLSSAYDFLNIREDIAVVCGRRKETHPENSIYNELCDIEWNTPIGEAKACGGDALMRIDAIKEVKGYRNDLIAGEEPELCVRLRQAGWLIWRLDADMTLHDANIMHFKQWWKRSVRAGYAFAEGASIHGAPPEYHWVAESRRAMIWGGVIPGLILIAFLINTKLGLLAISIYFIQILKITYKSELPVKQAFLYAVFLTLGKFPEQVGQLKFHWNRLHKNQGQLIEYK